MKAPPPHDSEAFSEPVIFHKVQELYRALHERVMRFPKTSRYSLGARIEEVLLEILELLYFAQAKKGVSRLLILTKADVKLKMFFTHLRLSYDTKCLNDAGYADLSSRAVEIGKMVGGWIKKTKTHESS